MIGAIVGDVVGSRFEFHNHRDKNFQLFDDSCFATDDSIMTIAVAAALWHWDGDYKKLRDQVVKSMQDIGRPYPHCGYGSAFLEWMYSDNPQPYYSFGNGAAMRVSPVAYVASSIQEVKDLSYAVTSVTHNHPEGIKGAECVAVATYLARKLVDKDTIIKVIEQNYYKLDDTVDSLRETYRFNETCQETVPQAMICFKEGNSFEDVLRNCISIGGDSDTLAAIACSVAGAYYGVPKDIRDKAISYLDDFLYDILVACI